MEFKQLEAFIHVVEQKSFSKAAKKLYLTQPTISVHIASLEEELNTELIVRNTKEVKVSPQGERLYTYAKEMIALREETMNEFLPDTRSRSQIVLAASTIPSQYILPEVMAAYGRDNGNSRFSIKKGDSLEVIKLVQNQQVEVGFVGTYVEDPKLLFEEFYEDELTLVTPNTSYYQSLLDKGFQIEVLLKEPIILRESGSGTKKEAERYLESKGVDTSRLYVVAHMNDQEAIKKSVSEGLGISIMSKKAAEDYVSYGKLLVADIQDPQFYRKLYIVHAKNKRLSRQGKAFIEFVKEYFRQD